MRVIKSFIIFRRIFRIERCKLFAKFDYIKCTYIYLSLKKFPQEILMRFEVFIAKIFPNNFSDRYNFKIDFPTYWKMQIEIWNSLPPLHPHPLSYPSSVTTVKKLAFRFFFYLISQYYHHYMYIKFEYLISLNNNWKLFHFQSLFEIFPYIIVKFWRVRQLIHTFMLSYIFH